MQFARGCCHVMFAFDVGFAIDLDEANKRLAAGTRKPGIKHTRRSPAYFEYRPLPLRIAVPTQPVTLGQRTTLPTAECLMFDFGAVSVSYRVPISGELDSLTELSELLHDHAELMADARRQVEALMASLGPAIDRPSLVEWLEDYIVFQIDSIDGLPQPAAALETTAGGIAKADTQLGQIITRVLRGERGPLSRQEVADALAATISYSGQDVAVIDWNAAVLIDQDADDLISVLEYANVELLEMRYLDDRLDTALEEAFATLARRANRRSWILFSSGSASLARLARLQMDNASLFEGVNNALKLIGDPYLARVYRLAAERLHLPERDAAVLRKIGTLESISDKIRDFQGARRMELLEWIIIILIAVSMVLPFIGLPH